jgi:superfamily I DNA and/or RNA helicase
MKEHDAQNLNLTQKFGLEIQTIDSFQGQERDIVCISAVRSNDHGEIGFLKDYRRMNVAMTRAKKMLIVIGDSATLGADPFYEGFITYCQEQNGYKSAWELMG